MQGRVPVWSQLRLCRTADATIRAPSRNRIEKESEAPYHGLSAKGRRLQFCGILQFAHYSKSVLYHVLPQCFKIREGDSGIERDSDLKWPELLARENRR